LRTLTNWKSDQYRRTGRVDRFAQPWIFRLLDLRAGAMAAGATDFLATPIFLRDAISVGRLSVHTSEAARKNAHDKKPTGNVDGDIQMRLSEHYGLFYLLRAMAAAERTGILQLARGNRRAELRIHAGILISVSVGAMQGLPALHHLLLWEEAAVSLLRRPVPKRSQLHLSSQELLDECERFLRDFAHSAKELGAPRTIYVPAPGPAVEVRGLQPSQMTPLLRLFDGRRGLSDVIEDSPFRIFDTVRMIRRLREANALVNRPDGPRERAPTGPVPIGHAPPNGAPRSMLEQWAMVPDQRGIVGDRRSTSRRLRPLGPPAPVPAPIPLVAKKSPSGPNRVTSGELTAGTHRPTPAPTNRLSAAPSVQVAAEPAPSLPATEPPARGRPGSGRQATLDADAPRARAPSNRQAALEADAGPRGRGGSGRHAPVDSEPRARPGSGRHSVLEDAPRTDHPTPRPARRVSGQAAPNAADTFDAIEADFFAREADLYKREAIESFDDLDPVGSNSSGKNPRKKR
ncbi:MAG TPA: DUF4388 domain-containing protein, partial [Polyangia bacterium]|nr:DUF4388 domain-containing protein [Polyangia bacterium]